MSNDQIPGGEPQGEASGHGEGAVGSAGGQPQKDTVSYDSYSKLLGEKKSVQTKMEAMMEELNALKQDKLSSEGKKDELLSAVQKERDEWKSKAHKAVNSVAQSQVNRAVSEKLLESGCQNAGLLIRAYSGEFSSIDFDDNFEPSSEQVKAMVETMRQDNPQLFGKAAPKIGSHQVKTGEEAPVKTQDVRKMKDDELMSAWSKAFKS